MNTKSNYKPLPVVTPPLVIDPNSRYSLREAFAALRFSDIQGYRDMKAGKLAVIREGRRTYIHGSELIRRAAAGVAS